MVEKKLSEELKHCLEDDSCGNCHYGEPEIKLTCRGLLQKAYEVVKEQEEAALNAKRNILKDGC